MEVFIIAIDHELQLIEKSNDPDHLKRQKDQLMIRKRILLRLIAQMLHLQKFLGKTL